MNANFPGSYAPGGKSRLGVDTVRAAASGRWPSILADLGIAAAVLGKRGNQPCPACGGRDRFQFIDKDAGRFVCRALDRQGGDGFALVEHWLDCGFADALRAVAGVLGLAGDAELSHPSLPHREAVNPTPCASADRTDRLSALWDAARSVSPSDPVGRYLARRGLGAVADTCPAALRYHPALPYWHPDSNGRAVELGRFPALLARLTAPDGTLAGLHRIYLSASSDKLTQCLAGELLPAKKLATVREGASKGAAARLYPPEAGRLALAEGIETALAVAQGSGLPAWACVSAGGLARVILPPEATDVWVFADHDASGTGQRVAKRLARRLRGESRRVRVLLPELPGVDWLDVWGEQQKRNAT